MAKKKRNKNSPSRDKNGGNRASKPVGQTRRELEAAKRKAAEHNARAEAAWGAGQRQKAIRHFERAVALDDSNPVYRVNLARSYGLEFDRGKAQAVTKRLIARHGNSGYVHYMLGENFVKFKDFTLAEHHYRKALSLSLELKIEVRSRVALARVLERLHRLEEAMELADESRQKWPDHPKANLIRAQLLLRMGERAQAYEVFEALSSRGDVSPDVKADSWYALAGRHDSDGDYDAAFAALQRAKGAYRGFSDKSWHEARVIQSRNEKMLESVTHEHFDRWSQEARRMSPLPIPAVSWLIGHPRSGTTLIEQALDSHPGLISADELEVFASSTYPELAAKTGVGFSASVTSMLDEACSSDLSHARESYLTRITSAIGEPPGNRVLLDKNPEMTLLVPVICRVFPEAKLLFALRDPRDVVLSCYMQSLPLNSVAVHFHTLEGTAEKYRMMLSGWLRLRQMIANPWHEVRYEDTVDDLEEQCRGALGFLGLEWDPVVLDYYHRARDKHVHSPTYQAVTKPIYRSSVGRWKNYEKHLSGVMDTLSPFIKEFGYE